MTRDESLITIINSGTLTFEELSDLEDPHQDSPVLKEFFVDALTSLLRRIEMSEFYLTVREYKHQNIYKALG